MTDMSTQYKLSKKSLFLILLIYLAVFNQAQAEPFSPTLLKLSADPVIAYDFDGSELRIRVTVHGTPAGLIFCVFTRGKADRIANIINGYLGWHHVNRVDTCVYVSTMYEFDPGEHVVTWDGKYADGSIVSTDQYTYYMWAFDNKSIKQKMCRHVVPHSENYTVVERDASGLPRANPLYYTRMTEMNFPSYYKTVSSQSSGTYFYPIEQKWIIGNNPLDESLVETCAISLPDSLRWYGSTALDPINSNFMFVQLDNESTGKASIAKFKWVTGGEAEFQYAFGNNGLSDTFDSSGLRENEFNFPRSFIPRGKAGVVTDGNYLYTADSDLNATKPDAYFYIFDMEGTLVDDIDVSSWWSSQQDFDSGSIYNGGPSYLSGRHGKIFLNSHASCLKQMVDPIRYLESGNVNDFYVWTNGNGDYTLDKNFEETAANKWICNDSEGYMWFNNISADDNLFSLSHVYDAGAVSFGLMAPDGTGLGFFAYAWETASIRFDSFYIDSGTPFDGLYTNSHIWNGHSKVSANMGTYFIAHDSIEGIITYPGNTDITPLDNPKSVTVLSPNGYEKLVAGTRCEIAWRHRELEYESVKIIFSSDKGTNWQTIQESVEAKTGSYTWTVPDFKSDECLIMIRTALNSSIRDYSDGFFSIVSGDIHVDNPDKPLRFSLSQNHPNPFNPVTTIPFTLPRESRVSLAIYNIAGEKVTELADGIFPPGKHSIDWDATGFSSGVYFYKIEAGKFVDTKKLLLLK